MPNSHTFDSFDHTQSVAPDTRLASQLCFHDAYAGMHSPTLSLPPLSDAKEQHLPAQDRSHQLSPAEIARTALHAALDAYVTPVTGVPSRLLEEAVRELARPRTSPLDSKVHASTVHAVHPYEPARAGNHEMQPKHAEAQKPSHTEIEPPIRHAPAVGAAITQSMSNFFDDVKALPTDAFAPSAPDGASAGGHDSAHSRRDVEQQLVTRTARLEQFEVWLQAHSQQFQRLGMQSQYKTLVSLVAHARDLNNMRMVR